MGIPSRNWYSMSMGIPSIRCIRMQPRWHGTLPLPKASFSPPDLRGARGVWSKMWFLTKRELFGWITSIADCQQANITNWKINLVRIWPSKLFANIRKEDHMFKGCASWEGTSLCENSVFGLICVDCVGLILLLWVPSSKFVLCHWLLFN